MKKIGAAVVLLATLSACGEPRDTPLTLPAPSVSRSTEPLYIPSPIKTVTLEPQPGPTTAETTPSECRFATRDEVADAIGEAVSSLSATAGGCWYQLAGTGIGTSDVKINVYRNRVAQAGEGEVAVSGLGGKATWDDDLGALTVQLGRNAVWIQTGYIRADDKLGAAKKVFAVVRKRI